MLSPIPQIHIRRPFAVALGVMLFVSCTTPTGMCACSPKMAEAVVYGRVTDAAGAGVSGARVALEYHPDGCDPAVGWPMEGTVTGAGGRYRIHLRGGGGPGTGDCLLAHAAPPAAAASVLRASDTVHVDVDFAYDPPLDSAQVDLVLRAP